ncbi:MAG: glycyl-radical enzyme activating protein [Chloroflexi bacterium]|nr:glycyl-radical enzyme activating protein [Chloroflexota bacterium]
MKGIIFDFKRFSVHDGPGIRTTVFLKGCPLSCWWCHNPESQAPGPELIVRESRCIRCYACVAACEQGAISQNGGIPITDREKCVLCGACAEVCYAEAREIAGREMTVAEVMAEIERDAAFYEESGGGVTFSGGEPLLQGEFLIALLEACRERGIHTAVDTSGFAPWETMERVGQLADLFLYDLKLMDDAQHRKYAGATNRPILENLQALSKQGREIVLRIPLIPGINDDEENIRQLGRFAAALPHLNHVDLLPYHRMGAEKYERLDKAYTLPDTHPPSKERVSEIAQILRGFGLRVEVGG